MPVRIQRKRTKGWKMPENTVYVGRPTKFGNPFSVKGEDGHWFLFENKEPMYNYTTKQDALSECINQYKRHMTGLLAEDAKKELKGKNLACFCPLDQPCHADVLLELANK